MGEKNVGYSNIKKDTPIARLKIDKYQEKSLMSIRALWKTPGRQGYQRYVSEVL